MVDTCNIAVILFFKCDVTKFRIPPSPPSHNVTLHRPSLPPLTCDVIYGCPLIKYIIVQDEDGQSINILVWFLVLFLFVFFSEVMIMFLFLGGQSPQYLLDYQTGPTYLQDHSSSLIESCHVKSKAVQI